MTTRTLGVEEELLLVEPETGLSTSAALDVLSAHAAEIEGGGPDVAQASVETELFREQIETQTPPCRTLDDLEGELRRGRRAVGQAAAHVGVAAVAAGVPILMDRAVEVVPKPRYRRIREGYGELTHQTLACAMHVHVAIEDAEEGVRALDGIGPWLPVLLALSANSPYFDGRDTLHESWRDQICRSWPSHGTGQPFGDAARYRDVTGRLVSWGAALEERMVYLDARLSSTYPTVELRIADICTDVEDAVLIAALARALVTTYAVRDRLPGWRGDLLRAATWRAARFGIGSTLVDPRTQELSSPRHVVSGLVEECREALEESGDLGLVRSLSDQLLARGNGAMRQRRTFGTTGELTAVVEELRKRTEASWSDRA